MTKLCRATVVLTSPLFFNFDRLLCSTFCQALKEHGSGLIEVHLNVECGEGGSDCDFSCFYFPGAGGVRDHSMGPIFLGDEN